MRNSLFTKGLLGLVVLSVLATASLALLYVRSVQTLNLLQLQTTVINRNRSLASSLAAEAVEYSKRNPAIDPVLQSVGLKPKTGPASHPTSARPTP